MSKVPSTVTRNADADAILRARAGITLETAVRRILRAIDRATPADIAAGATWYGDGSALLSDIAAATGLTRGHAAAIVAHLSPRTPWARNVSAAWHVATRAEGEPRGAMGANVARARVALGQRDGARALATLRGPKVSAFAANLMGDSDRVTIDVWAARVALAPDWSRGADQSETDRTLSRTGVYAALERAYQIAAQRRGLTPSAAQATAWVVVRNGRAH